MSYAMSVIIASVRRQAAYSAHAEQYAARTLSGARTRPRVRHTNALGSTGTLDCAFPVLGTRDVTATAKSDGEFTLVGTLFELMTKFTIGNLRTLTSDSPSADVCLCDPKIRGWLFSDRETHKPNPAQFRHNRPLGSRGAFLTTTTRTRLRAGNDGIQTANRRYSIRRFRGSHQVPSL
jgi:hypothetical protein